MTMWWEDNAAQMLMPSATSHLYVYLIRWQILAWKHSSLLRSTQVHESLDFKFYILFLRKMSGNLLELMSSNEHRHTLISVVFHFVSRPNRTCFFSPGSSDLFYWNAKETPLSFWHKLGQFVLSRQHTRCWYPRGWRKDCHLFRTVSKQATMY